MFHGLLWGIAGAALQGILLVIVLVAAFANWEVSVNELGKGGSVLVVAVKSSSVGFPVNGV